MKTFKKYLEEGKLRIGDKVRVKETGEIEIIDVVSLRVNESGDYDTEGGNSYDAWELEPYFGEEDEGSPIEGVRKGIKTIEGAYAEAGIPQNFSWYIEEGAGHVLSQPMWEHVRKTFEKL